MFEELVQTIPDHTAVVFKDKKYTYRELDEISDRLGKYIASQGIGSEDVVSILIPRCEYMAIAPMGDKGRCSLPASGSNLSQGPPDVHDGGFLCKASHC